MTKTVPSVEHAGSPGVHAALSVLEALVARGALGLTDMAADLGVAKSSLHRVCAVLVDRGWVIRTIDGRFDLGIRAIGMGSRAGELPIVTAFRATAPRLLTAHNETVCLSVVDGEDSVHVALEETSHPVRFVSHVGNRTPVYASAAGRVVLADRADGVLAAQFGGRALVTPTGRRLTGVGELLEILEQVRRDGYAINDEDTAIGLVTLSAPIRNGAGAAFAALTICVPSSRITAARRKALLVDLVDTAQELSDTVKWLPSWNATRAE